MKKDPLVRIFFGMLKEKGRRSCELIPCSVVHPGSDATPSTVWRTKGSGEQRRRQHRGRSSVARGGGVEGCQHQATGLFKGRPRNPTGQQRDGKALALGSDGPGFASPLRSHQLCDPAVPPHGCSLTPRGPVHERHPALDPAAESLDKC